MFKLGKVRQKSKKNVIAFVLTAQHRAEYTAGTPKTYLQREENTKMEVTAQQGDWGWISP